MEILLFAIKLIVFFVLVCLPYVIPIIVCCVRPKDGITPKYKVLNRVGLVINIILGLVYVPLSLVGSLSGMIGEGYMYDTSLAQSTIIGIIEVIGLYTSVAACGSLAASIILRRNGWSIFSFIIQFGAIFHMILIYGLAFLLDYV